MKLFGINIILLIVLIAGCGDKMPLPSVINSPESFGANDTSYVRLNPDWTASSMGYFPDNPMRPVDITIGVDSYIFIADENNDRILTVDQSGDLITHKGLNRIFPVEHPLGIDIDPKLNLLIVNGTNKIYIWNQFINNYGIEAVAIDTTENGEFNFTNDAGIIDSVLGVLPFYIDENENSSFQDVAFGPSGDYTVFVTDNANCRILKLNLAFTAVVDLGTRYIDLLQTRYFPLFSGIYAENIAECGSGAGTVDNPQSITCDQNGNIYFTQLGGNFLVQKLNKVGNTFTPGYELYKDPIMDLNRFLGPQDLALGKDDAIFVLDTGDSGKVSKFFNKGPKAGQLANLGKKGLVNARFLNPTGIAVSDDEVVYITNTDENKIERFQYSVSEDDIPQEPL
jgi:hypothetical protein